MMRQAVLCSSASLSTSAMSGLCLRQHQMCWNSRLPWGPQPYLGCGMASMVGLLGREICIVFATMHGRGLPEAASQV